MTEMVNFMLYIFHDNKKRKEELINPTKWMNFENIMLRQNRHKKCILYESIDTKCPE